MVQITKLRCIRCGHIFFHVPGDIVVDIRHPRCPECGSILAFPTIKDIKK